MSSAVIPRKLCFHWKCQEIGRSSRHSNRGQRRHVHIRGHAVGCEKGNKRNGEKEREKGRVDDVVGRDKLAAVSFETAPRGPLWRVISYGRGKVIPTYLPTHHLSLACTSGAATRAEDTAGIRRADQVHPVFHHFSLGSLARLPFPFIPASVTFFAFALLCFFCFSHVIIVSSFSSAFLSISFFILFFLWRLLN